MRPRDSPNLAVLTCEMGAAVTTSPVTRIRCAGALGSAELREDTLQTGAEFEEREVPSSKLYQLKTQSCRDLQRESVRKRNKERGRERKRAINPEKPQERDFLQKKHFAQK